MSAKPKQTHSDLFCKPHVAGRVFHTHAVVHYSGSMASLVYCHGEGFQLTLKSDEYQKELKDTQTHGCKYDSSYSTYPMR